MSGDAVFKLFATLGLDTSEYDEGLDNSEKKGSSFGTGLKVAAGVTTAAITATTAATVAGTKAFVEGVSSVAQYGDTVDKMSQKMNMSATAYQEWDFIMQHCGASIETLKAGIKTLSSAAETNNDAFAKLGITEEQIASMSGEELFGATITALQGVEDETQRTYLAGQVLGRGATELGALLNMSAEDTEEMRQQVHELGGVMSDDAVKDAARFQDSLQNMQVAFGGIKRSMLSEFLPSFSTVMDGLSLVFSGDSDSGLGLVKSGVEDLASNITELAPTFIQIGSTILEALVTAIIDNLPLLIESGILAVEKFVDGILDNADLIITAVEKIINIFTSKLIDPSKAHKFTQTAINIIVKLASGLIEALPQLIPAIASVIAEIVRTLTQPDNLSMLIQCALQLILALAMGLVDAIPEIVKVIPEIVVNIVTALIENTPVILETLLELVGALGMAVFNLIGGLLGMDAQEIKDGIALVFNDLVAWGADVLQWLSNGATNIKNKVTGFFTNIVTFFSEGFNNIKDKVTGSLDNVKEKFSSIFENVKTTVYNAIEYLKGLFHFDWKLPDLKLPHFSITGQFSLDPSNLQLPKISVEWYKKAYDEPYILEDATIFGSAGGRLLGGGEGGSSEVVVGTNRLMEMIATVVKQVIGDMTFVVPVYVGGRKIDEQIVTANARNSVVSGGR